MLLALVWYINIIRRIKSSIPNHCLGIHPNQPLAVGHSRVLSNLATKAKLCGVVKAGKLALSVKFQGHVFSLTDCTDPPT